LPPTRDLAGALRINSNTVLRALRQLRDEGVLEFRRGRGISVLHRPDRKAVLASKARALLEEALRYGYERDDVLDLIKELP